MQTSEMNQKPKIYVFSAHEDGGEGPCYALAQDGTVLGSHWCSSEFYASHDLGVTEGSRPDRHKNYEAHYPNGYEMEFVSAAQYASHQGLQKAVLLNKASSKSVSGDEQHV